MNLNHIHIGTRNLESSVSFYQTYFGFKKKFDHSPGIFLDNSSGFLLAIDPVESVPILPSWYHIGFCLENEAEVIRIYDRMKSNGVSITRDLVINRFVG